MSANVLVVHGGGPTAVINASLYGVVEEAKSSGSIGRLPDWGMSAWKPLAGPKGKRNAAMRV